MRWLSRVLIPQYAKRQQLKLRLGTLLDRKRAIQQRVSSTPKLSSAYRTIDEGFKLFNSDLDKLQVSGRAFQLTTLANTSQQFIEINQTAFSKILKKVSIPDRDCENYADNFDSGTKPRRYFKPTNEP